MIQITNPKVAGFAPIWATFRGFSLLFDNPGDSFVPMPLSTNLHKIHCDCSEPSLALYKALVEALGCLGPLTNTYLFCPLPSHSYHVTAWDGLNQGNVNEVSPPQRNMADTFLAGLPYRLLDEEQFTKTQAGAPLGISIQTPITFQFAGLSQWGNSVLVARLAPAERGSAKQLKQFTGHRSKLAMEFKSRFGLQTTQFAYTPHVSLGYFADHTLAAQISSELDNWNEQFRNALGDLTITFESISLYGFVDMATFFKLAEPSK